MNIKKNVDQINEPFDSLNFTSMRTGFVDGKSKFAI